MLTSNPKILERIFLFLGMDSLKLARQVKKLWSNEGAKSLITKYYIKIPSDLEFEGSSSSNIKIKDEFEAFLYHKKKDASKISKIVVRDYRDFALWKELGVLGPQVRSLKLIDVNEQGDWLSNLLGLPNLAQLTYLRVKFSIDMMKSFYFFIEALFTAMSKPEKLGKPLLITGLSLRSECLWQFEEIERLSTCRNISFEELEVPTDLGWFHEIPPNLGSRLANILNNILFSSQNTLKALTLFNCELFISLLEFPRINTLKQMTLSFSPLEDDIPPNYNEIPPSFRFLEKFPKLHEFRVHSEERDTEYVADFFMNLVEKAGPSPSLKRFLYSESINFEMMGPLFQAFPNIEDLDVQLSDCSQQTFQTLWNQGKHLQALDIGINLDIDDVRRDIADLDSLITGFSAETINNMKKHPILPSYTLEELQKMRVNPSILLLKELKELTISFVGEDPTDLPQNMLAITGEYSFKFMPNDARIVIDFKDCFPGSTHSFEQVSKLPNVTVQ